MIKEVFTEVFEKNLWFGTESVSGGGSNIASTKVIIRDLPNLIERYNIKSLLDIPCGDYNWMKECKLNLDIYVGADIVDELIINNNNKYSDSKHIFQVLDLTKDILPKVDLVIVKDCFIHLSYEDIFKSLKNIKRSGSKYLLLSHGNHIVNQDIETSHNWRGNNFEAEPFNFDKPIDSVFNLFMWEIDKIKI